MDASPGKSRRLFLAGLGGAGATVLLAGIAKSASGRSEMEEVEDTPLEDLMREHAVLERVLLVYEEGARRLELDKSAELAPEVLGRAAGIVRRYIEDHHERDEENHVFPRLERVGVQVELIKTLRVQHDAGRRLTSEILGLSTLAGFRNSSDRARLVASMRQFIRMYRPHAAHENTVLFPAFRNAVSEKEYEALRESLEKSECAAFGDHLYEQIMDEVCSLEKTFSLGDLAAFTPIA